MTLAPAPGTAGQSTHARLGETQISEWCILLPCLLHIDPVHQAPVTKVVPGSGIGRLLRFQVVSGEVDDQRGPASLPVSHQCHAEIFVHEPADLQVGIGPADPLPHKVPVPRAGKRILMVIAPCSRERSTFVILWILSARKRVPTVPWPEDKRACRIARGG